MVKFLYVTDIHGTRSIYERMFKLGKAPDIDFIIFGGDLTSGINPRGQKFFLTFYLVPRLWIFRKRHKKTVFIMMGNDDYASNSKILKKADRCRVVRLIHNDIRKAGKTKVVGYPFINETPFLIKDWEKTEEEIENDLEYLSHEIDPNKTIYVFHAPPYNTKLDIMYNKQHMGSKSIRNFIEKEQPSISLHGHIHESPKMSGTIKQKIGKTLCINPGSGRIIKIDTEKMTVEKIEDTENF
ncbi:MAG: metallophosphoesterase [Candidatus Aenigmarchaeota archaeon]|nr:metallophosphoesterase [Candidatus Aenigmarchaeota archaeon]